MARLLVEDDQPRRTEFKNEPEPLYRCIHVLFHAPRILPLHHEADNACASQKLRLSEEPGDCHRKDRKSRRKKEW